MFEQEIKELLYKDLFIKGMLDKIKLNIEVSVERIGDNFSFEYCDYDVEYLEKLYYRNDVLDERKFTRNHYDYHNEYKKVSNGVYFADVRSSIINSNELCLHIMHEYNIPFDYLIEHKDEINKLYDEMQTQDQNQNGNQKKMV